MSAIKMSATPNTSSSSPPPPTSQSKSTSLPIRTVPGSYGSFLSSLSDRFNYFWFQGPDKFFKNRSEKHKSTVYRTNVPPSFPFIGANPNVIALVDVKAYSHLFDTEIADKTDTLLGDFKPSLSYSNGQRVCPFLDVTEDKHTQFKGFILDILKKSYSIWVPTVVNKLETMWDNFEVELSKSGSVAYRAPVQQLVFGFLTRCMVGADPAVVAPELADKGYNYLTLWLALQVLPTLHLNIVQPLEEIFLHSYRYPAFLVQGNYNKFVEFIRTHGKEVIEKAENEYHLDKEVAIQNLSFILGFNGFGGFSLLLPALFSRLETEPKAELNKGLVAKLRDEVRLHCGQDPNNLTLENMKKLENVLSFIYETLRFNPPVPLQYARARKDFTLSSHEEAYEIKKGELLCGYQPLVMRDPKVFENPDTFVADRFIGEKGKELLNYLYWSNGPQTCAPTATNKQCIATEIVPLTGAMFLGYMFQRYDSVTFSSGSITAAVKTDGERKKFI